MSRNRSITRFAFFGVLAAAVAVAIAFGLQFQTPPVNAESEEPAVATSDAGSSDAATATNGKIYFSSGRAPGSASNLKIHTMNADGTNVTCLMCGTGDTRYGRLPAISPDGSTIAYVDGASPANIHLMNADGTNDRVLTTGSSPAWSPQGDRILFTRNISTPTPHNELFIISANGSAEAPLNDSPTHNNVLPVWSVVTPAFPEGRIAFRSSRDGNSEIYVIAPTAGQNFQDAPQVNVTNDPATDSDPAWSPDGTKLAFQSDRFQIGAVAEIYTMELNPNPGTITRLTNDGPSPGGFQDSGPVWAPDGTKIAYVSFRGNFEIIVINSSTGAPIEPPVGGNVTNNPAIDFDADWAAGPSDPRTIRAVDVTAAAGQQVVVSFELTSLGDEAGVSFTVNFDQTKLSNPFVTIGSGAPAGANIGTNLSQALSGRVGVLLDSVTPFAAGNRQMFTLRFNVAQNAAAGPTAITFSGSPTLQSVTNSAGAPLTTVYQPGNVTITAATVANGKIAYQQGGRATSSVYTITPGSGISTGLRRGFHPAYSPDGTKIVFTDNTAGATDGFLMLMDANGSNVRQLTTPRQGFTPTWSPDGTRLAFIRGDFNSVGDNGKGSLFIVDMTPGNEGANEVQIPTGTRQISKPSWGSTNRIVAACYDPSSFGTDPKGVCVTGTIPPSAQIGGNPPTFTLISGQNTNDREATWSPNGSRIAFLSTRDYPMFNGSEIYTSNPDGTSPTRLTNTVDFKSQPTWSPDGTRIAYSRGGTQGSQNATLRSVLTDGSNGTNPTIITLGGSGDVFPNWGVQPSAATPTPTPTPTPTATPTPTPTPPPTDADLKVELIDLNTESPGVDRDLSYTVRLRNFGPAVSNGTSVRIQIPSNTFLQSTINGCTRVGSGRNYDCVIGSMFANTERLFPVRVKPTAPGPITLFARVTSSTNDPSESDRSVERQLQVTDVPRPVNDDLANATPLTGENIIVNGSNVNATIERTNTLIDSLGETKHAGKAAGKSVWHLWQAPGFRGSVKIATPGSSFDTLLSVREFSASPLPVVAQNDDFGTGVTSSVSFRYTPGAAYYIAVDGYSGASGNITIKLDVTRFLFLSDPINQRITGFSPASACSSISDLNDLFCGYKREPGTGFLLLTIRGENFIPASKVLVDGQPPQGFDLGGNPVTGTTTFVSSSELLVRVPPNPPLLVERIARAGVVTTVDITTGLPAESAPSGTAQAVAGQTAQIKVLDLRNATLAPGETARICGATLFNDPNVETCMTMVHFGPGSLTVSPTWFAALAYCDGVETDTDRRLQCAESMSNGRGWSVNPRPGSPPLGSIQIDTRFEVPYGIAPPAGLAPQILGTGGMPAGLITDCSYCADLIGNDGGTLIGTDGSTMVAAGSLNLIGNDGGTLVGNDGASLIGNDGATLIGNDGGTLIGNDGSTRADVFGPNLMRRNALTGQGPTRPALPRSPGDLVTGNTGYTVIKGSGGSQPTVTYTADDVTGKAYITVSITLDNTSSPRASNVGNMSFTVGLNPGVLKLQSSSITVSENNGFATVTVLRSGDTSSPASFEYTTVQNSEVTACSPGSSSGNGGEKCDFAATIGAVRFEANETSKEIRIPIVDDAYAEGSETFKMIIGNAIGAAIELPSAASITITDNDTVNGPANPLDAANAQFFVRQQYLDLLGREPTPAEMTAGTGPIVQCGIDAVCRKTKSVDLSNALFLQAQPAWGYVFRLYRAAFGNEQPFPLPDISNPADAKKWVNYSAFSRDLALLTDGQSLPQKQVELANSFVLRRAFTQKYSPVTLNNGPAFVDAVLATIRDEIGIDLASQRATLISAFDQPGSLMEGRAAVIYRLADASQTNPVNNALFITAEDTRSFASALYTGYLKRDGDISGLNTLVGELQIAADRKVFIDRFIFGSEYRLRFGPTAPTASFTVSGRVLTPSGLALRNASVSLISAQGQRRTATTSSFGLFSFASVPNESGYTVTVASKRFRFSPRIISVSGDTALGDIVGLE